MSLPAGSPTPPDRIDPRALLRLRSRLLHAPERPWLHQEAARRMAERLPLIRQVPKRALDWSSDAPDIDLSRLGRTTVGAASLARIDDGRLPSIGLSLKLQAPPGLAGLARYHSNWKEKAYAHLA